MLALLVFGAAVLGSRRAAQPAGFYLAGGVIPAARERTHYGTSGRNPVRWAGQVEPFTGVLYTNSPGTRSPSSISTSIDVGGLTDPYSSYLHVDRPGRPCPWPFCRGVTSP